tara:strand:+ start:1392 stop:2039 length:648 start_codon:yes stop_codon:yes gene_type:complete
MIKLIIFDYDGVIVDSFKNIYEVYCIIFRELDKKVPSINEFKDLFKYNSRTMLHNLKFSVDEVKKVDEIFAREIIKKDPLVFEGIGKVILDLKKNYKIVLVSSALRNEVVMKLKEHKLYDEFNSVLASEDGSPMVKVGAIEKVMGDYSVDNSEVLMIGDRNVDFDQSIEAGLSPDNVILVDYGFGYYPEDMSNFKQTVRVEKPEDLLEAIGKIDS